MVCIFGVLSEERAPFSVFGLNPEYFPRIPGCGRNQPIVSGGGMLKTVEECS